MRLTARPRAVQQTYNSGRPWQFPTPSVATRSSARSGRAGWARSCAPATPRSAAARSPSSSSRKASTTTRSGAASCRRRTPPACSSTRTSSASSTSASRTASRSSPWSTSTARRCRCGSGARNRPSMVRKLRLLEELCDGLAYAHSFNIVHRDIKPANLMVEKRRGRLKILDFGIAKLADSGITNAGALIGSFNYMSPEQVRGLPIDHRSDIFSCGAVMFELLSYKQAFPGGLGDGVLGRIAEQAAPQLRQVIPDADAEVEQIINKALEKDPDRRYPDLPAMHRDLTRVRRRLERDESMSGEHTRVEADDATRGSHMPQGTPRPTPRPGKDSVLDRIRKEQIAQHMEAAVKAFEAGRYEEAIEHSYRASAVDEHESGPHELRTKAQAALDEQQADQHLADAQAGPVPRRHRGRRRARRQGHRGAARPHRHRGAARGGGPRPQPGGARRRDAAGPHRARAPGLDRGDPGDDRSRALPAGHRRGPADPPSRPERDRGAGGAGTGAAGTDPRRRRARPPRHRPRRPRRSPGARRPGRPRPRRPARAREPAHRDRPGAAAGRIGGAAQRPGRRADRRGHRQVQRRRVPRGHRAVRRGAAHPAGRAAGARRPAAGAAGHRRGRGEAAPGRRGRAPALRGGGRASTPRGGRGPPAPGRGGRAAGPRAARARGLRGDRGVPERRGGRPVRQRHRPARTLRAAARRRRAGAGGRCAPKPPSAAPGPRPRPAPSARKRPAARPRSSVSAKRRRGVSRRSSAPRARPGPRRWPRPRGSWPAPASIRRRWRRSPRRRASIRPAPRCRS